MATSLGATDLAALAWGAVFPLAGIVVGLARTRRLDAISVISPASTSSASAAACCTAPSSC